MGAFTFSTTRTIINEPGAAERLGSLCADRGVTSVLLVTDAGIVGAGLLDGVAPGFRNAGIRLGVFDQVEADPSDDTVLKALAAAQEIDAELVIGFGGGSSMDVAKLVAVLACGSCTQALAELYGVDNIRGTRLPLIQVPTTAGTGSEVTPIAIVTTGETTKAGVVSPVLQPDIALLDAALTVGLPPKVTAATGIDAMVHAIEAYTSVHRKNPLSDMLAREALGLLARNIVTAVQQGSNLQARGNMLLGALLAGQAFANAPVAAVHALAYPLGGHFHIPHGLSNSLVLPHVMGFNAPACAGLYAELAPNIMGRDFAPGSNAEIVDSLIGWIEQLTETVGLPLRLRDCGVPEASIERLAADAMEQQRLLVNNPRPVTEKDAAAIYRAAY
ncbi:iron-containing alcohol dehydrogenase [Microbulbifer hainanensis]|uniref:iron-containing alcohol dehydrogenase n=1 Tax=Microbulbifer hainanensis TaxID=2735675 RepID=UPI0018671664|nr:iron-containing alcohol dehydrogenase [Microbulbifer hainanensis]